MQSTTVQTKVSDTKSLRRRFSSAGNQNKVNAEFADPFLQIIMSMMAQSLDQDTQSEEGVPDAAGEVQSNELLNFLPVSFAGSQPNGAADISALSQLADILALTDDAGLQVSGKIADVAALLNLTDADSAGSDAAAQTSGAANAVNLIDLLKAVAGNSKQTVFDTAFHANDAGLPNADTGQRSQAADLPDLSSLLGQSTHRAGTVAGSADALAQVTELLGLSDQDELQPILKNAAIEVLSEKATPAQDGMSEATVTAKQMLSDSLLQQNDGNQGGIDKQDEIDVDKLQNELAKTDTQTPFRFSLESVEKVDDSKLLEQVTEGIKKNISLGKTEFAIKLKPESIGEITVKLVEEAGKTILTISAARAQTAKLINNDLDALREAVAPMNVEVREAVASTNEAAGGAMQQFNMAGQQQFAGQQFAGQQSFYQMTQSGTERSDGLQAPEEFYGSSQEAQVNALLGNRLDAYI